MTSCQSIFYVITGLDELAAHAVAVRLVADLARDVHVDLVGVEPGSEPVMLHGEDVCAEGGNVVEQLAEAAGAVEQRDRKAQAAAARHQTPAR